MSVDPKILAMLLRGMSTNTLVQAAPTPVRQNYLATLLANAIMPPPTPQTTYLSPNKEAEYRSWLQKIGQAPGSGYNIDRNWNGTDYDYRGFFDKYGPVDIKHGQHFTDEFKLPNHATFSDQSIYATGQAAPYAGSWTDNTYTPSPVQIARGKKQFTE